MSSTSINLNESLIDYMQKFGTYENSFQSQLREETESGEFAQMQISPEQGQFMGVLAKIMNAKNYLEIGTFKGYSAMCMAFAMGDESEIVALDSSKDYTDIALRHWKVAGISNRISLRLGLALDTLIDMSKDDNNLNHFDIAFIDADKTNYQNYFDYTIKLVRRGGGILIDNVFWSGNVCDLSINDDDTVAIRKFNKFLSKDRRVSISIVPIGDGLTVAYKL